MVTFLEGRVFSTDTYPDSHQDLSQTVGNNWQRVSIGAKGEDSQGYTSDSSNGFSASTYYNSSTGKVVIA